MAYYVAIDIGGTAVKHGVADAEGRFLEKGSSGRGFPPPAFRACWTW